MSYIKLDENIYAKEPNHAVEIINVVDLQAEITTLEQSAIGFLPLEYPENANEELKQAYDILNNQRAQSYNDINISINEKINSYFQ